MSWLEETNTRKHSPLCHFKKYRGKEWTVVVREDPDYVEWLLSMDGPEIDGELYDYLTDLIENV